MLLACDGCCKDSLLRLLGGDCGSGTEVVLSLLACVCGDRAATASCSIWSCRRFRFLATVGSGSDVVDDSEGARVEESVVKSIAELATVPLGCACSGFADVIEGRVSSCCALECGCGCVG